MADLSLLRRVDNPPAYSSSFVTLAACALVLGVLGPFGTAVTMALPARLTYWATTCGLIGGMAIVVTWAVHRCCPATRPSWPVFTAVAVGLALPGVLIVRTCLGVWSPISLAHVSNRGLFFQVLFLNLLITFIGSAVIRRRETAETAPRLSSAEHQDTALPIRLKTLLPPPLKEARLYALEAQDHYLRVHTSKGHALIHMRISDAEALFASTFGARVHRSFWVARDAIQSVERSRGAIHLHLISGLKVPVSRRRARELDLAGMLGQGRRPETL